MNARNIGGTGLNTLWNIAGKHRGFIRSSGSIRLKQTPDNRSPQRRKRESGGSNASATTLRRATSLPISRLSRKPDCPFTSIQAFFSINYASGEFVRPLAFEPLLEIRNIRFALAHIGNPWYDECILLHAKFTAAVNNVPGVRSLRMFIDLTPGVTRLRRHDALRMLLLSGYADTVPNILWGTDNRINGYNVEKAVFWRDFDRKHLAEIVAESHSEPEYWPQLPDDLWERITDRNFDDFYGRQKQG